MIDYPYIQLMILILLIMLLGLLINTLSKKTGRDTQKDIKTVVDLLDKVKKAAEDGKITDDEIAELQAAAVLAKDSVMPYVDLISESGIIPAIYKKIKGWLT